MYSSRMHLWMCNKQEKKTHFMFFLFAFSSDSAKCSVVELKSNVIPLELSHLHIRYSRSLQHMSHNRVQCIKISTKVPDEFLCNSSCTAFFLATLYYVSLQELFRAVVILEMWESEISVCIYVISYCVKYEIPLRWVAVWRPFISVSCHFTAANTFTECRGAVFGLGEYVKKRAFLIFISALLL